MKKLLLLLAICFLANVNAQQSILDLVNQTNNANITTLVKELSGEQATTVGGSPVTITHRVSDNDNNLAANYIKERLEATGLTVVENNYSSGGRNIIATQTGVNNPNDIYIIGAHYDSVANYCADDNASGTAAVIELARMLAPHCLDKTLIYALWDEEEIGLRGSRAHAQALKAAGANVLGVMNIDMMAFDGDDDNDFDIDVRNIAGSVAFKDQIVAVLNDTTYGFNLNVNVVNPGTGASDHGSFWNEDYSALLFGESWHNNDKTTGYHTSNDRDNLFNYPYYYEMFKLVVASMATMVNPIFINKTVAQNASNLTANETSATSYQWVDCNNSNAPIAGATNQTFAPSSSGTYAVQITKGNCTKTSDCIAFVVLSSEDYELKNITVFPNPAKELIQIEGLNDTYSNIDISIKAINGQEVLKTKLDRNKPEVNIKSLANGAYLIKLSLDNGKEKMLKFIKE
ncbi:M28 family metallopeptidase [Pseudofulvibacter geojedonensis]|uniref:M28 family peptidase n=1 Tax=Pseudofulvibacter geojedonensis TaxID=1123758 RepID=A0ABW3HZW4_9FLAO